MAELAGVRHVNVDVAASTRLMPPTYCRYGCPHGSWCQGPIALADAK